MNKVSIVVPTHNSEKTILACLCDILEQVYQNFECIVVDDASTDTTVKVVEEYIQGKNQFVLLKNEINMGPSATRNKGIDYASGDFLVFIDSDDRISKYYLQKMLEERCKYDADVVICLIKFVDKDFHEYEKKPEFRFMGLVTEEDFENAFLDLMNNEMINAPVNKLFSRRILNEYGIRFPIQYRMYEDAIFCARYLLHVSNMVLLNEELYYYIQNAPGESLVSKFVLNKVSALDELYELVKKIPYIQNRELYYNKCQDWYIDRLMYAFSDIFRINHTTTVKQFQRYLESLKDKKVFMDRLFIRDRKYWYLLKLRWYPMIYYYVQFRNYRRGK